MTEGKGTYSLISVDVAPDEEVVRVDAHGVHRDNAGGSSTDGGSHAASVSAEASFGNAERARGGAAANAKQAAESSVQEKPDASGSASRKVVESDSYDGRGDLEGPVPMAGMQRAIIVVVVLCLIAFIVYFAVSHG